MNNMDSHRGMQFVTQFKQILQLGLVERHNDSLLNYLLAGNRDELVVYLMVCSKSSAFGNCAGE